MHKLLLTHKSVSGGGQDTHGQLGPWGPRYPSRFILGAKMPRVGAKIPQEILAPGGQAARGYLSPRGPSCPGAKINWDTRIHGAVAHLRDNFDRYFQR